ncbi:MAG: hypothetical protein Fur0037_14930 [Planctomycetota bacterium]
MTGVAEHRFQIAGAEHGIIAAGALPDVPGLRVEVDLHLAPAGVDARSLVVVAGIRQHTGHDGRHA